MTEPVRLVPQGQATDKGPADTIEQVRDLLFGEAKREHDDRIAELDLAIKSLNTRITEQLGAIETKMEAMSQALSSRHDESLRQIGEAIVAVGRQISALGSPNGHDRDHQA